MGATKQGGYTMPPPIQSAVAWLGRDRLRPTHLRTTLTRLLVLEHEEWEPLAFNHVTGQGEEVTKEMRDLEVSWAGLACQRMGWQAETKLTSASLLDRLLHTVRIPTRYLHPVAAAAVFLAAKIHEEDENIPSTHEIIERGEMECSARELLRMEKVLLDKLNWHLRPSVTLDLLQVLHALAYVSTPRYQHYRSESPTRQLSWLTERLWGIVCDGRSGNLQPSILTLALLSMELEATHPEPGLTLWLQSLMQVSDIDLMIARELILDILGEEIPETFPCQSPKPKNKSNKKISADYQDAMKDDDLYVDIKKLYAFEKASGRCENEEDAYLDIRHLYSCTSPLPAEVLPQEPTIETYTPLSYSKVVASRKSGTIQKKRPSKPSFKAKTNFRNSLKVPFKIPCKITFISSKKIFEEPAASYDLDEDEDEYDYEMMDADGVFYEEPIMEPVGLLNSPVFSPMSPEFPIISKHACNQGNGTTNKVYGLSSWQKQAAEVSEQSYRPLTYAQVLRLHLTPFTRALGV